MKIENEKPLFNERETLHYHFDGKEWCLKWEEKFEASDLTYENIDQKLEKILQQVHDGKLSPVAYYIYNKLNGYTSVLSGRVATIALLSSYTGISKRHIKKHLKPEVFNQLDENTLRKYAEIFEVSVEELINV